MGVSSRPTETPLEMGMLDLVAAVELAVVTVRAAGVPIATGNAEVAVLLPEMLTGLSEGVPCVGAEGS
jgi:hypothetical protein